MKKRLIENLLAIAKKQNIDLSDEEGLKSRFQELLDENGFEEDRNIPAWMDELFDCIANKKAKEKTPFSTDGAEYGDFINFSAELEDLIEGEYDFYGEDYQILYDSLGIKVSMLFEGKSSFVIEKV